MTDRDVVQSIIEAVRHGIVIVDDELRVSVANAPFQKAFGVALGDMMGRRLDELGRPALAAPALTRALEALRTGATVEDLRIEVPAVSGGPRMFLLCAGPLQGTETFLLGFEDVTEAERARIEGRDAEARIRVYQDQLQRMAFDAALTEERERRRIAIALHDRIGQALALAQIHLSHVRKDVTGPARTAVDATVELLEQATADQRTLVFDLSPPVLYDLGLKEALAWLAEDIEKRHGLRIDVADDGREMALDDTVKAIVFRAVRELVMNVLKHAKTEAAQVSLRRIADHFHVDVEDHGVGFDPRATSQGTGFGLLSVREQIARLGGTLEIESAPERGTHVSVRVPLSTYKAERP
jgi:signal transduction histidine kinase